MGMFDVGSDVVIKEERDSLGGILESDFYDFTIKMAYVGKGKSGAMSINLNLESNKGNLRQTIYISSGTEKGGSFTYVDKNTKEKKLLRGYSQINSLCLLAIGKPLKEISPENKTINIYNFDLEKDVPTEVPVMMDLLDKPISAGVLQILEDKYNAEGTRKINKVDKWFRAKDKLTVSEILAETTEPEFVNKWLDKNKGIIKDETKPNNNKESSQTAAPAPAPAAGSVFG